MVFVGVLAFFSFFSFYFFRVSLCVRLVCVVFVWGFGGLEYGNRKWRMGGMGIVYGRLNKGKERECDLTSILLVFIII